MIEILSPAGNLNNLIASVESGANAVYLGLQDFSARKNSKNFTLEELKYGVSYANLFGVKTYLTVNTLYKDSELKSVLKAIIDAYNVGVDAFILQDLFLGKKIKEILPNVVLHLSTQAGVCNEIGAIQAKENGFSRVILARETKLSDIKAISKIIETEVFVQGALCTCLSGHCYMSSFIGGNSGNRGFCKQPCRMQYAYEYNDGTPIKAGYPLSLSDLCLKDRVFDLIEAGVTSFKIEGRMRSEEYVRASVMLYKSILDKKDRADLFKSLKKAYNRGDYTEGLAFSQKPNFISSNIQGHKGLTVATVDKVNKETFTTKNFVKFSDGDAFKILRNNKEVGNGYCKIENGKQKLFYKGKVCFGDEVSVTKDVLLNDKLKLELKRNIAVKVSVKVGKPITLQVGEITLATTEVIEPSKTQITTRQEVENNVKKVDKYPFNVSVEFVNFDENAFVPKGVLNRLRAQLYENLFYKKVCKINDDVEKYYNLLMPKRSDLCANIKAVILNNTQNINGYNTVVYAPKNYKDVSKKDIDCLTKFKGEVYLYLPPFMSGEDIKVVNKILPNFNGLYINSYWQLLYAKMNNKKVFAGVGVNVFNSVDVDYLLQNKVDKICASKELSVSEIASINKNLVILEGNVEIMDLIYCPFSKDCQVCKYKDGILLKDTQNRRFVLERYQISECRFRLYNCHNVILKESGYSTITDVKVEGQILNSVNTNGNLLKGVL
ncbi:MAG: U32 family peptidase [Clostridia bacterium]|nr:U32 family peptidase [Clostridia bacterium]